MASQSPVLDSKTVFQNNFPPVIQSLIEQYCAFTQPISKTNDPEKAAQLRAEIMGYVSSNQSTAADVLRAVRQNRGEVRGLLMDYLETGIFKGLGDIQASLLTDVLIAQGNDYQAVLRNSKFAIQPKEILLEQFKASVAEVQKFIPEIEPRYALTHGKVELGLTYDGFKIDARKKLGVPDYRPIR